MVTLLKCMRLNPYQQENYSNILNYGFINEVSVVPDSNIAGQFMTIRSVEKKTVFAARRQFWKK